MKSAENTGLKPLIISSLISGTMAATLVGGALKYYFDGRIEDFRSQRTHDMAALTELVGPAVMQLERSKAVADRYSRYGGQNYGDAAILSDANRRMRELLLTKAHLMTPELIEPSQCLVVHYDIWLKLFDTALAEFRATNNGRAPDASDRFDVGYAEFASNAGKCGNFQEDLPRLYRAEMDKLRERLFKSAPSGSGASAGG